MRREGGAIPSAPGAWEGGAVAAQLGRPLRSEVTVVRRCHLGLPVVVRVPPVLRDGTPFPTRHWLSCPLLHRRLAALEAGGAVRRLEARRRAEPDFEAALQAAHEAERRARAEELAAAVGAERLSAAQRQALLRGGVAGARAGVKCLHAHLAHFLAGHRDNPVGAWAWSRLGEPRCERPCVEPGEDGRWRRAPGWRPAADRG